MTLPGSNATGVLQVRALLYVGALSNGILEALAHAERAITDAIVTPVPHLSCTLLALHPASPGAASDDRSSLSRPCWLDSACSSCRRTAAW